MAFPVERSHAKAQSRKEELLQPHSLELVEPFFAPLREVVSPVVSGFLPWTAVQQNQRIISLQNLAEFSRFAANILLEYLATLKVRP
jgi:hypothetical protein